MHNELGITKEDIRQWVQDSVEEQAKKLVDKEFNNFDVHKVVQRIITDDQYFGSKNLKREISQEMTKQILERIKFE
jgi:serine protease inhibitor